MSDTPRTDAVQMFFGFNPDEGDYYVSAEFARQLERELWLTREYLREAWFIMDEIEDIDVMLDWQNKCAKYLEGTPVE